MLLSILAFLVATLVTMWIVRSASHSKYSADHDLDGPQKFHARPVPRVGGVGIFAGLCCAWGGMAIWRDGNTTSFVGLLLLCALPAFVSGVIEDLTKNVSPRMRLFFTAVAAALAYGLLDARIDRVGLLPLDWIVALPWLAAIVTVTVVAGVTNAVNIIDGFNGLASMCTMMMLVAIGWVAFQVGDQQILVVCMTLVGAILGFFIWNFPGGHIFLGDGGAYMLGFLVAELSILLVHRNAAVAPEFPLLLCAYPIVETLFSIYRKRFLRNMSPGLPDAVHLHMLVYRRMVRWHTGTEDAVLKTRRNSMTSPYLWGMALIGTLPAAIFWDRSSILLAGVPAFVLIYVALYWRIVRFRVPRWMVWRRR